MMVDILTYDRVPVKVSCVYPTPPRRGRNDILDHKDWTASGVYTKMIVDFNRAYRDEVSPAEWNKLCKYCETSNTKAQMKTSRWFHPFHALPSRLRKYLRINGSSLSEVADLPCSALLQLAKVLEKDPDVELQKDVKRLQSKVLTSDIYTVIAGLSDNPVTPESRGLYKKAVQQWINICSNQRAFVIFKGSQTFIEVDRFFKMMFPVFHERVTHAPLVRNKRGKLVSVLVYDIFSQEFQTMNGFSEYLNKVCKVCPVTCHDAIYLGKDEEEMVVKKFKKSVVEVMVDYYKGL
jgi:hypothetical protein